MKINTSKAAQLWRITVLGLVFAVGLLASQASAETIRIVTANTNNQYGNSGGYRFLDLSTLVGPQNILSFATSAVDSKVIIRFDAECRISGSGNGTTWVDINIIVDPAGAPPPVIVSPTNSNNAFCSGKNTSFFQDNGSGSYSAQAVMIIGPVGVHTVRVLANGNPGGVALGWRINGLSLTVESQP